MCARTRCFVVTIFVKHGVPRSREYDDLGRSPRLYTPPRRSYPCSPFVSYHYCCVSESIQDFLTLPSGLSMLLTPPTAPDYGSGSQWCSARRWWRRLQRPGSARAHSRELNYLAFALVSGCVTVVVIATSFIGKIAFTKDIMAGCGVEVRDGFLVIL